MENTTSKLYYTVAFVSVGVAYVIAAKLLYNSGHSFQGHSLATAVYADFTDLAFGKHTTISTKVRHSNLASISLIDCLYSAYLNHEGKAVSQPEASCNIS
jgi:hypothetical protein